MDPEHPYFCGSCTDAVGELDGQLRFANTAQADEGRSTGRLGALSVDPVKNVSALDEIAVAAEGDRRERLRRRFWLF